MIVATSLNPCTQVLASKLDKPFIDFFPAGPIDPMLTSIYPNSNRRALAPNPLPYVPSSWTYSCHATHGRNAVACVALAPNLARAWACLLSHIFGKHMQQCTLWLCQPHPNAV